MTTLAPSPHSPVIERRPRSRSFGTGTPTFSSDLAKLKKRAVGDGSTTVHSYPEAIKIASTFDVLGTTNNSPLNRKLKLSGESDWIEFMKSSGAVVASASASGDGGSVDINLEKLLRYCFDIAFKMPPSPTPREKKAASPTPLQI